MIKQTIKYDDFEGREVNEDFYFNLTKLEALEFDMEMGGLEEAVKKLTKTQDGVTAYKIFKQILLMSVGVKSEDGRRFIKNQHIRDEFEQSPALGELVLDFISNPGKAGKFIEGLLPAKAVEEGRKLLAQQEEGVEIANPIDDETETPVEDNRPAWLREGRDPTKDELNSMPKEELLLAMQLKMGSKS